MPRKRGYSSLLGRVRGQAGVGRATGRTLATGRAYDDLEAILKGAEGAESAMEASEVREGQRSARMKRYGDVGRVGGAIFGSAFGPEGQILGYGAGGRAGSELGEHYAFTPGKLFEGIWPGGKPWQPEKVFQKRPGAKFIDESIGDVPVKFHQSKKAQLQKRVSEMNRFIRRSQVGMNQQQWAKMWTDFMDMAMVTLSTNQQARAAITDWRTGKGPIEDIFSKEVWKDYPSLLERIPSISDKFFPEEGFKLPFPTMSDFPGGNPRQSPMGLRQPIGSRQQMGSRQPMGSGFGGF